MKSPEKIESEILTAAGDRCLIQSTWRRLIDESDAHYTEGGDETTMHRLNTVIKGEAAKAGREVALVVWQCFIDDWATEARDPAHPKNQDGCEILNEAARDLMLEDKLALFEVHRPPVQVGAEMSKEAKDLLGDDYIVVARGVFPASRLIFKG